MSAPILATKLYIPPPRPNLVLRPRLIEQLSRGLHRKLTLISAPAGFGKTTLASAWVAALQQRSAPRVAWLALDEADREPTRFFTYCVAALQRLVPAVGKGVLGLLQAPQPPPIDALLTTLLNDLAAQLHSATEPLLLVLDDYHVVEHEEIDQALTFLIDYLPPQLHLILTTREDPSLPLARLRARGQLTEVRAADLRFTPSEAAEFLNRAMALNLTADEVAALAARTEGWIAGLQLAAISVQSHLVDGMNRATFIQSFTGSHRFVMDYLLEEVLHQQPAAVQRFLLYTAILDRFCGPLCDAVMGGRGGGDAPLVADADQLPSTHLPAQTILEALEQANLFIVPLDNERRWYRYHHLFGELLRQRFQQQVAASVGHPSRAELHLRASQWYEENDQEWEAFQQATLAHDLDRAARLVEGNGMPLHFRGAIRPVLKWLETLSPAELDAHPSLWLALASTLLGTGQVARTQEALHAAEALLATKATTVELDESDRDLLGRVAAIRATIAAGLQQVDVMIAESRRALAYLLPDNQAFRTSTHWKLGYAYHLEGDLAAASNAYQEAITKSQASGNTIFTIMSHIGLGDIYLAQARLMRAAEHYRNAIALFGEQLLPSAGEAYAGLARIYYEWNELATAGDYAAEGLQLAQQWEKSDSPVRNEWLLARVRLAKGDITGAAVQLAQTVAYMQEANFTRQLDEIVATQVLILLTQGEVAQADALATAHDLPLSQARVSLAQDNPTRALWLIERAHTALAAQHQTTQLLGATVLQIVTLDAAGQREQALQLLGETLVLTAPDGFIRLWLDEGPPIAQLLHAYQARGPVHGNSAGYLGQLLAAFAAAIPAPAPLGAPSVVMPTVQPLPEPLSDRELEVLRYIAAGHKNQEIAEELFVSLNTVRYHTKNLYGKLGVNKRTQAVARAQALGLI